MTDETQTGRTRRTVVWGLLDQILASVSNFIVIIIAARSLPPVSFGSFAVAFEVYYVSVFVARGMASDPLATAHTGGDPEEIRWAGRSGASTTLFAASCVAVVTAAVSQFVGGTLSPILLALAVLLPGLTLQDYLRYLLIVQGKARAMFFNDLFWLVCQLPLMWLAVTQIGGGPALLIAWGVAGTMAAILGLSQAHTSLGRPRLIRPWLAKHRKLWPYFLLDNLIFRMTNLILVVVISMSTSLVQVAGFRAAMTVYAPLTIIGRGIVGVAVPELSRRRDNPMAIRRAALLIAWFLAPTALIWAGFTLLIPESVGKAFLGDSWTIAEPLIFLAGITTAVGLFTVGTAVGLRALGAGRDGLTARMVVSVLGLVCAAVGGLIDGAYGVFLVLALSAPFQIATWW
ncbi:MAG: hypothetical protein ABIR57_15295, partial [Aeromicrobium sp.]